MKTRLLIIFGIIVAIAISTAYASLAYYQEIMLVAGMMQSDERPEPNTISDPICLATALSSGESVGAVMLERCFTSSDFEEMGCTKPMLEHILRYSNLLDYEVDGLVYLDWAGLPNNVSQEKFDECFNAILEKRPILNSEHMTTEHDSNPVLEPDSLDIPNEERDNMLALGYKLFPGVGWVHMSNHTGIQNPIYRNHPDTGEQVLDIDAMIQVQKILSKCDYVQKLESGEIPAQNPDGSHNAVTSSLRFYNNGTHYIDSNTCKWVDSLELLTYHCFEAKPTEQNWYFGPAYFDNGTHHLDRQYCDWEIKNEN